MRIFLNIYMVRVIVTWADFIKYFDIIEHVYGNVLLLAFLLSPMVAGSRITGLPSFTVNIMLSGSNNFPR